MSAPILEAHNITKRFSGVVALKGVSFDLLPGEVHAIIGENGAGKSTLIKVLSGLHPSGSFEGSLLIHGNAAELRDIRDAEAAGIAVIHQELALVGEMSVSENIFLGHEPLRNGWVDWLRMDREARVLLRRFKLDLNPEALVGDLGVGHQQLIEIVKALARNSRILILDEPTAALSATETQALLEILRGLRAQGLSLIYISHKLDEVFSIADRITVLRDGETISTAKTGETDSRTVIRQMVGREITDFYPRRNLSPQPSRLHREEGKYDAGAALLQVEGLTVSNDGRTILSEVSFEVRGGEVLGIGGLMGAGRSELLLHLFGAFGRREKGSVKIGGAEFIPHTPADAIRRGMVLFSEDRKRYGLVLDHSIGFNLSLSSLDRMVSTGGWVDQVEELRRNREFFQSLRIKAPDLDAAAETLSGGNQQKVVLGKALMTEPKIVLLDEPTRGIDVAAKLEVYELINRLSAAGIAIVLVSSELPELMGMSDRIVMIARGRMGECFARGKATAEQLMASAVGTRE